MSVNLVVCVFGQTVLLVSHKLYLIIMWLIIHTGYMCWNSMYKFECDKSNIKNIIIKYKFSVLVTAVNIISSTYYSVYSYKRWQCTNWPISIQSGRLIA